MYACMRVCMVACPYDISSLDLLHDLIMIYSHGSASRFC